MDKIRWLPLAVYSFALGGTGLGFGVGLAFNGPNQKTLIIISVSFIVAMIGYVLLRPYMRQARDSIKAQAMARMRPKEVEQKEEQQEAVNDPVR